MHCAISQIMPCCVYCSLDKNLGRVRKCQCCLQALLKYVAGFKSGHLLSQESGLYNVFVSHDGHYVSLGSHSGLNSCHAFIRRLLCVVGEEVQKKKFPAMAKEGTSRIMHENARLFVRGLWGVPTFVRCSRHSYSGPMLEICGQTKLCHKVKNS